MHHRGDEEAGISEARRVLAADGRIPVVERFDPGKPILVERIEVEGWPVAVAAESMRVSRETARRWLWRWRSDGVGGLEDRSSRPRRSPNQAPVQVEESDL